MFSGFWQIVKIRTKWYSLLQKAYWTSCAKFIQSVWFSKTVLLSDALSRVKNQTGQKFVIIIDEWDVLIRDEAQNQAVQEIILIS